MEQEKNILIAKRVPPGDRFVLVDDEKQTVYNSLTETLEGYFQAYKYCGELEMFGTHDLIAKERSIEVEKIFAGHNDKTILVIHIRLGDYLNEENFGTPSSTYYSSAINKIADTVALDECWIFSNDVEFSDYFIRFV
jgi:hypothetical protein